MFSYVMLESEHKALFATPVEADRHIPKDQRGPFMFISAMDGSWIQHPGLAEGRLSAYSGDVKALGHVGLLAITYGSHGSMSFDVTPMGFKYYEYLKQSAGEPIQRIESSVKEYLTADRFRKKYPRAFEKWTQAEAIVWKEVSEPQQTTIGHCCREALQL